MGPIQASASSSAKSGDVWSSSSFSGGDFIVNGSKNDLGAMLLENWPLLLLGVGVVWYLRKKKKI